jgi:hypothetical protein
VRALIAVGVLILVVLVAAPARGQDVPSPVAIDVTDQVQPIGSLGGDRAL